MSLYERVIELCQKNRITKTNLEKALGFSQNSINKWKSSMPSLTKLQTVAAYFEVTPEYLLFGNNTDDAATMEKINQNLTPQRIKALRVKSLMSPQELANKIGSSKSSIYRYENGEVENIPTRVVNEIAQLFGVSTMYLLGASDDIPNDLENKSSSPKSDHNDLGRKLKKLRIAKGMTAEELAAKVNVAKTSIYRYETGAIKKIPATVLMGLADALGVSHDYFLSSAAMPRDNKQRDSVSIMNMGQRLYQLRKAKGATQEEVGAVIGMGKTAIRKYECGAVENIKRSSIEKLANYFGVSPSYLMCFTDDPTPIAQRQSTETEILDLIQTMTEDEKQMLLKIIKGMKG